MGRTADEPLSEQFALFVNVLEVLKGDGTRGTTIPDLVTREGQLLKVDADGNTTSETVYKRRADGRPIEIQSSSPKEIKKTTKQLQKGSTVPVTLTLIRQKHSTILTKTVNFDSHGKRGVLKAALHFMATQTDYYEQCRRIALNMKPFIFMDDEQAIRQSRSLKLISLSALEWGTTRYNHSMIAWQGNAAVLVGINLFGITPMRVHNDAEFLRSGVKF